MGRTIRLLTVSRWITPLSIALLVATTPFAVQAQPAVKVARIGYLASGSSSSTAPFLEAFRQGLRERGWVQGQNVAIDYRFANGRINRLPALAAELVLLKPDVIVAVSTPPALAARNAAGTIPVVMIAVGDPQGAGLIESLARPGGNVTGLSFDVGLETFSKSLELLTQIVPNARRVAVLTNPANPAQARAIMHLKDAARSLHIELQLLEARGPSEFDGAFAAIAKARAEALLVVTDSMFILHRKQLADLAARDRLASMFGTKEYAEAGGLVSYGPNLEDIFRRAAIYVDKALAGIKPAGLAVEQPTKFELIVNIKTAKALGLTIPQSILLRADQKIQ